MPTAGAAKDGGRRPTVVAAPAVGAARIIAPPAPADVHRPGQAAHPRRDGSVPPGRGDIGAILRREGVYSSTLCEWRRQRDAGAFGALTPAKRGPKAAEPNPLAAEVALLRKDNAHLTRRLARADAIIAVQKKLADLLGIPMASDGDVP